MLLIRYASLIASFAKLEDQLANIISVLIGAIFATQSIPLDSKLIITFASASSALMGMNTLNQYCDVEIDEINRPYRPLPSGKIKPKNALISSISLFILSLILASLVNLQLFALAILGIFLGIIYSVKPFRFKDLFMICNISIALGYGAINFLAGWVVYKPILQAPISFIIFFCLFDMFANMTKDYRDVEGDSKFGTKTLPVILEKDRAMNINFMILYIVFIYPLLLSFALIIPKEFLILTPIGMFFCMLAHLQLSKGRCVLCYFMMMLLYIVIRVACSAIILLT